SKGASITTVDGKTMLDFHGNYIHNLGFGHPKVIDAITEQMQTLSFSTRRYTNEPAINLAKKLTEWAGGNLRRVLFAPGGAEAIGMAMKIARMATGRFKTISMWESFHGASLDTISLGGEAIFRNEIGPLLPGTEHAPPTNPSGCPFKCGKVCNSSCADYVEYMLEKEGDIGAVVAETIRSSPFIPPKEYWQRIREACDNHGALLILDEIPHALGRTGKPFTFHHYEIEPDMVVIGKGLGGGIFPFAAVIAKDELNEAVKERAIGHYTHEKNPVASAAALTMMEVIENEGLFDHVQQMSDFSMSLMKELKIKHEIIHDVRALGLMIGLELRNPDSKEKSLEKAETVMYRSFELGLNFKLSMGCIINLTPPMNVTKEELEKAFLIIDQAIAEVT
ncbi:MAG: (R)-1-hydroxy-2-aminoethylphosphonate ammonia-lyase, partial [Balneolaceae bacterium]